MLRPVTLYRTHMSHGERWQLGDAHGHSNCDADSEMSHREVGVPLYYQTSITPPHTVVHHRALTARFHATAMHFFLGHCRAAGRSFCKYAASSTTVLPLHVTRPLVRWMEYGELPRTHLIGV